MGVICLKVRYGPTKSYKLMNFGASLTCAQVSEEIRSKYGLSEEPYFLYSPPCDAHGPLWLDRSVEISMCNLAERDTIEMKFRPQDIFFCISEPGNNIMNWIDSFTFQKDHKAVTGSLKVDFTDPINEYIPSIRSMMSNIKEEYVFQHIVQENGSIKGRWLNSNLSLLEQDVTPDSFLNLLPVSSVIGNKKIESEVQELEIEKSSFMTKKSIKVHKITAPKKRWCVLRAQFLFYYASQSDTHACGVIPVEYYDLEQKKSNSKYEITLKHKEESFSSGSPTYVFECEDETEHENWMKAIIRKCVIGAGTTVFGVRLGKVMARKSNRRQIPAIIKQAVEFLQTEDSQELRMQGLFRISGSAATVFKFKEDFDRGLSVKFDGSTDPHVVAGLLKLYVRELPEPLIPFSLYKDFIGIQVEGELASSLESIRGLILKIPKENQKVMKYLLELLLNVSKFADENLMTVGNLAVVFGPNVLRPCENSPESANLVSATTTICKIMELLISFRSRLFPATKKPPKVPVRRSMCPSPISVEMPARAASTGSFVPGKSPRRALSVKSLYQRKAGIESMTSIGIKPPPKPTEAETNSPPTGAHSPIQIGRAMQNRPKMTIEDLYERLEAEILVRKQLEKRIEELEEIVKTK